MVKGICTWGRLDLSEVNLRRLIVTVEHYRGYSEVNFNPRSDGLYYETPVTSQSISNLDDLEFLD